MKYLDRYKLTTLMLILMATLSAGCLQADLTLKIDEDGAGSFEAEYSITENAVAQLNSMITLAGQLQNTALGNSRKPIPDPEIMLFLDPDEKKIRAKLDTYKKFGLVIDKLRVRSRNSRRSVNLRLEFEDLARVARADFFADAGFSLYRRKSGNMLFYRKSINDSNAHKDPLVSPNAHKLIEPLLEGFKVTVKVICPSRILETNTDSFGVKSATWIFDQDRDPKAFTRLQNQTYMILMDGTGVQIPDIKIVTRTAEK